MILHLQIFQSEYLNRIVRVCNNPKKVYVTSSENWVFLNILSGAGIEFSTMILHCNILEVGYLRTIDWNQIKILMLGKLEAHENLQITKQYDAFSITHFMKNQLIVSVLLKEQLNNFSTRSTHHCNKAHWKTESLF